MLGFAGADKLFGFHRVEPRTTRRSNAGSSTDTGRAWTHPENSLVSAASCTCSSRPTTGLPLVVVLVRLRHHFRRGRRVPSMVRRRRRRREGPADLLGAEDTRGGRLAAPRRQRQAKHPRRLATRTRHGCPSEWRPTEDDESGRAKVWLWARRNLRFDWYNWQRTAVPFRSPSFMVLNCLPIRQLQRPLTCLRNFKKTVKPLFKEIQIPWTHAAPAHSS